MTTNTNNSFPAFDAEASRARYSFADDLLAYADTIGLSRDVAADVIACSDDDSVLDDADMAYTDEMRAMHVAARSCYVYANGMASFDTLDDIVSALDELGLIDNN